MSKKKRISTAIVTVLVVALICPFALRAGLTETLGFSSGSSLSSLSSFITFFNAKDDKTALYVTKEVESPDPDDPAPADDEFEFILSKTTGGVTEPAPGVEYYLQDEKGRIYIYDGVQTHTEDKTKFEDRTVTDENGSFKLKAGQTAVFEGLVQGDTFVVEEIKRNDYDLISPASGSQSSTLTMEGSAITFKNQYKKTKSGTLEVRKNVSYPDGYQLPETPEFKFAVKIAGKAYAEKDYTVYDVKTDNDITTGTTDKDGYLTLHGDTYAKFENVPADVDYTITEILSSGAEEDGWRIVGNTSESGATQTDSGTVTNFTNVLASFIVSKEMFGGITVNEAFQFQILDGNGRPFGESLKYYLYDRTMQLVDEDIHLTAEDGTFTLKDGQKAVFIGLAKDTEYGVRELDAGRYIQFIPQEAGGYTDKVVMDSVEELPFVNASIPEETLLTVTKQIDVDASDEDLVIPDNTYTFQIMKIVDGEAVPVKNAAYDISHGSNTSTHTADENGIFTLKAWETARFVDLEKGVTYRVQEIEIPRNCQIVGSDTDQGELGDDVLAMKFVNCYVKTDDEVIEVLKTNAKDKPLAGARLQLIQVVDGEEQLIHEWVSAETAESISVKPGEYILREIEAPNGYEVAEDQTITVHKTNGGENDIYKVSMVDHRDTRVPTGVELFGSPLMRALMVVLILLAAAAVYYRGRIMRRKADA